MTLKNLILSSVFLVLLLIVAVNTWHLQQLTENVRQQLGTAAFEVSKNTVQSMLSQKSKAGMLIIHSTNSSVNSQENLKSGNQKIFASTKVYDQSTEAEQTPLPSPNKPSPHIRKKVQLGLPFIEESVELRLKDKENSRSIILSNGIQKMEINIPRTQVEQYLVDVKQQIFISSSLIVLIGLLFFTWLTHKLVKPLQNISVSSQKIGEGQFGIQVSDVSRFSGVEIKHLVQAINKMSNHLLMLDQEKQQLQEQQKTNEISEITRGLAHTLRNPLHTITLVIDNLNDSQHKMKSIITQQIQRIDEHIKSLMVITTHETLKSESISLSSVIEPIISQLCLQFPSLHLTFDQHKDVPHIEGLSSELSSIFHTIIVNACEATTLAKKSNINISLTFSNQHVIQIIDEGVGFSENIQEKMFTPHNTNKPHGAGMGLYIAMRIVKGRYQGNIEIEQEKNEDIAHTTKVTITLLNRV